MQLIALNHMTAPALDTEALLHLAQDLGFAGVELRNDLARPLFDGLAPRRVGALAERCGQRILALAEVKAFNDPDRPDFDDAVALAQLARDCGAQGIALIPRVARKAIPREEQIAALETALTRLRPLLEAAEVTGLIEPLGFVESTLRHKQDVAEVLDTMGNPPCFRIVHDTFHHHIAGGGPVFAALTGIVHVSGVVDPDVAPDQMTDAHRVLVDAGDRLGNIDQLRVLRAAGYDGPASFEAFAPEVHALTDPASALAASKSFIETRMQELTA
ncbi:TIM barrel protein [Oceanibium sediminis]|uniref:TIM barrel protein n=1 Tax=Oceanibium sediminis TaxID=2026339 RepID=UPI000DD328D6|nr:TIM barrel protein [Oceanibium sediminis]